MTVMMNVNRTMDRAGRGMIIDFMMSFNTDELLKMSRSMSEKKGGLKKPSTENESKITWFRKNLKRHPCSTEKKKTREK